MTRAILYLRRFAGPCAILVTYFGGLALQRDPHMPGGVADAAFMILYMSGLAAFVFVLTSPHYKVVQVQVQLQTLHHSFMASLDERERQPRERIFERAYVFLPIIILTGCCGVWAWTTLGQPLRRPWLLMLVPSFAVQLLPVMVADWVMPA